MLDRISGNALVIVGGIHVAMHAEKLLLTHTCIDIVVRGDGEEEEMLRIPGFAHQLGLDFISHSLLRALKNSPLRKAIENTPGYYLTEDGKILSDKYPLQRLRAIRRHSTSGSSINL
ncbi:MAG: hypothetical protein E3K32_05405 [wastewater metagenome]|nr:hypothetical protein [Candidatus Loosdrechtia aerotolerans]